MTLADSSLGKSHKCQASCQKAQTGIVRKAAPITASVSIIPHRYTIALSWINGNGTWRPSSQDEKLLVGRSDFCNITINNSFISRMHGYFTIVDHGCAYFDQSHNGSIIAIKGHSTILHNNAMLLTGNGKIFLGYDFSSEK